MPTEDHVLSEYILPLECCREELDVFILRFEEIGRRRCGIPKLINKLKSLSLRIDTIYSQLKTFEDENNKLSQTEENDTYQEKSADNKDLRDYNDFMIEFDGFVSNSSKYTVKKIGALEYPGGTTFNLYNLDCVLTCRYYMLSVETDKANKIISVNMISKEGIYDNAEVATLAYYIYLSMGFEIKDRYAFFEKYDLFSEGEIHKISTIGRYITSSTTIDRTNDIIFSVSFDYLRDY